MALAFLGSRRHDAAIEAKKAFPELVHVLAEAFDAKLDEGADVDQYCADPPPADC